MTKFEAIRSVTGVKEFSVLIFELVKNAGSPENLEKELSEEITAEGLQTLMSVARRGNYPFSLVGTFHGKEGAHTRRVERPMELRVKPAENKGCEIWLDDKKLHHVESYKIESSPLGNTVELSVKILARYQAR